jgi:SAM-dependent methyltransferase
MTNDTTRVWAEDMSTAYDEHLVPAVFQPFADDLAARIASSAPRRVLELAAGTGAVTRAITTTIPDAELTATDLNVAMVDVGAVQVPAATWQQADATSLPFDDASFDVVACQFGVMFFPDKQAAFSEVRRVLTPGGRFVFNCWGPLEAHDYQATITAALVDLFPDDPPGFLANVPHGDHDTDRIKADLQAAGLVCDNVETVELTGHAASAAGLAVGYCRGTPLRAEIEARGDLEDTTRAVAVAMERRYGTGPAIGRLGAVVIDAHRP